MASPFQQHSLIRKWVYGGLILALFTGSYLFRTYVVQAQADTLGLREGTRGEVELTDSAVRLALTGMRGWATSLLWIAAREKQVRHEWNELEMLVKSVVKLQPHFVTPWLFQSWNIAFNVPAECDNLSDKYFYISEGILILAEGESKNRGSKDANDEVRFPGNPNMRFYMGFYNQLKIGQSDETRTMRSLYQLSCIKPADRDPDKLERRHADGRREVDAAEFERFCKNHPRLVRRLREQLDCDTPQKVIAFLRDHRDVPSRFDDDGELKKVALKRFPMLPPKFKEDEEYYDQDTDVQKGIPPEGKPPGDDFDNFAASRAWYAFAQEPLPRPDEDFAIKGWNYPKDRYRLPRMNNYIFRQYPALAQSHLAEELANEGWFDLEGWTISSYGGKDPWFYYPNNKTLEREVTVAKDRPEYSSRRAWDRAFKMVEAYGRETWMGMSVERSGPLHRRYRELITRQGNGDKEARDILSAMKRNQVLTNFLGHYYEAEAERTPEASKARKDLYQADMFWKRGNYPQALKKYDQWLVEWKALLTRKEEYRKDDITEEDSYEKMLDYFRKFQKQNELFLRPLLAETALAGVWPNRLAPQVHRKGELERFFTRSQWTRILPTRNITGPFDEELGKDIAFFLPDVVQRVRNRVMYKGKKAPPPGQTPEKPKVQAGTQEVKP